MEEKEIETFCPASQADWRKWLQKNHRSKQSVWLICYKKNSDKPTIGWSEIVDEALCFGWVDGKRKSIDHETFIQFLCKRKASSTWSKVNKAKIIRLIELGLMTQAGLECIEKAKQNGSWTILDDVEELTMPMDLIAAFKSKPGSKDFFLSVSKSARKAMLQWIVLAKRPETRQKRIDEITALASQKMKPKQFR